MLFNQLADFDAGQEHVVVMCVKCENAGVKARIEAMTDKSVVRCTKCGAWKLGPDFSLVGSLWKSGREYPEFSSRM